MLKTKVPGKGSVDAEDQKRLEDFPRALLEVRELIAVLKAFGVTATYEHLEHPETTPEACIKSASRHLDLMAFHGEKWLTFDWLEPELERLRKRMGKVRFLLSDSTSKETFARCRELVARFPTAFEVRFFKHQPMFRVVIIDDRRLYLGHYGYEVIEKDGKDAHGWKSPQLYVEDNKEWSLFIPFRALFRLIWDQAEPLEQHKDEGDRPTIKREFHQTKGQS